ncbi:hypothetical protein [Parerythrobacter aestuarii]|uniref:hypothetical protein n=1 Tax=Parerythrobacter aestuarii TaxID=3020909 RepID=UPI0024DE9056|nr:hypothetical protein [Parerythrobacter aestuarii]
MTSLVASGCGSSASDANELELEQARTVDTGCSILLDFVEHEFKKERRLPLHLSREKTGRTPPVEGVEERIQTFIEFERSQGRNPKPDTVRKQVVAQLRASQMTPLEACPELRKFSERNSYEPKSNEAYPATTADGLSYRYETLSIEMPFIDFDNGTAGFNVARVCGPLCGAGTLVMYERADDGSWKFKEEQGTWIS